MSGCVRFKHKGALTLSDQVFIDVESIHAVTD